MLTIILTIKKITMKRTKRKLILRLIPSTSLMKIGYEILTNLANMKNKGYPEFFTLYEYLVLLEENKAKIKQNLHYPKPSTIIDIQRVN